jgi:hypothetical protein
MRAFHSFMIISGLEKEKLIYSRIKQNIERTILEANI